MPSRNAKQTSKSVATKASKILTDKRYGQNAKSVAGSALAQTKPSTKKKKIGSTGLGGMLQHPALSLCIRLASRKAHTRSSGRRFSESPSRSPSGTACFVQILSPVPPVSGSAPHSPAQPAAIFSFVLTPSGLPSSVPGGHPRQTAAQAVSALLKISIPFVRTYFSHCAFVPDFNVLPPARTPIGVICV